MAEVTRGSPRDGGSERCGMADASASATRGVGAIEKPGTASLAGASFVHGSWFIVKTALTMNQELRTMNQRAAKLVHQHAHLINGLRAVNRIAEGDRKST